MKIKRYLFFIFALLIAFVLTGLGYSLYLIKDLSPKLSVLSKDSADTENNLNVLEEGSFVRLKELKNYHLFSSSKENFDEWRQENKSFFGDELLKKGLVYIKKDISLEPLLKNTCPSPFCYQHKMLFGEVPSIFWKALIGIEDIRFIFHRGVDFRSIARAIWIDLKMGKLVQGGSTITQQLVKNLYFSNEKTLVRKIKELIIAIYIEKNFSKDKILETYFNEFVWGALQGTKVKGLLSATLFYFGKKPKFLSSYEAAILVALLKGPNYYHPIRRTSRLKKRTDFIFEKLKSENLYSRGRKSKKWSSKKWKSWVRELRKREKRRSFTSLEWSSSRSNSASLQDYEKFSFIKKAQDLRSKILKRFKEPKDISIKGVIGRPFEKGEEELFYYYSKRERSLKRAVESERHQVGSVLKPLIYRAFLENGRNLEEMVSLEKITLSLKSGLWVPREANKRFPKKVSLKEAMVKSFNRPVVRIASEIGFDNIEKKLRGFVPRLKGPLKEYPSQLLGSIDLSLREIYEIYKKFIKEDCLFRENKSFPSVIEHLSDPRVGTVRNGVGPFLKLMKYFGKTGTSNNGQDNWYVFFTGKELGVIWVGLEGKRKGKDLRLFGSTTSFRLFQGFYRERGRSFSELNCF